MKKILILPALIDHIDFIAEAKSGGYEVNTCDNNPDNVGHRHADVNANISLLEVDKLVQFAKDNAIDAVSAFSTDIGALSAAYIAENLNLVGNPVTAVEIMANKRKFRTFLQENNFNTPLFQTVNCFNEIDFTQISFPLIIKPTDRAGSKGVFVVETIEELKDKLQDSLKYSFEKRIIIEDYVQTALKQIHGDAIVQNGEMIFCCLGDQFFGQKSMRFSPIGTVFPSSISNLLLKKIEREIQKCISLLNYKNGGLNIEVRIDHNENVYIIELGPRYGGNYIPKTIGYACNINMIKYAFDIAIGRKVILPKYKMVPHIFQFILRSEKEGIFKSVSLIDQPSIQIIENYPIKKPGDMARNNNGPENIIGIYILKAFTDDQVKDVFVNTERYFFIEIDTD